MLMTMGTAVRPEVLRLVAQAGRVEAREVDGRRRPFRVFSRTEWNAFIDRLPEEFEDDGLLLAAWLRDEPEVALLEPKFGRVAAKA